MQNSHDQEDFTENSRITALSAASRPLTTEKYRPVAPSKWARRMSVLRQALCLPRTLFSVYRIIREEFAPAALDEYLWAFWGFHQEVRGHKPSDPHYRARTWQKTQLSAIGPGQVVGGLGIWEMAFMMNVAMENEDPIMEYSHQNGEGFRFLLPTLGRFMGKNEEQARYAAEQGLPWCESAWCAEERRHSNTFARIIERLLNVSPNRDNPNQPMVVTADEYAAARHIINRQATEWNASSSYIVMAAHSAGGLHTLLRNIVRDEIKHLAILSSADIYLFGPRPWRRFLDWIKLGIGNYQGQRKNRTGGSLLGGNHALSLEGIVAHLLTAFYLAKWLRTVPLRTLVTVFDTPSVLPDLAAFMLAPEMQAAIDETLRQGKAQRVKLARWQPKDRARALTQQRFEEEHAELIQRIITTKLDQFRGAEISGSLDQGRIKWRIANLGQDKNYKEARNLDRLGKTMLGFCLGNRLRDYQIRNNRHVAARTLVPDRIAYRRSALPTKSMSIGQSV